MSETESPEEIIERLRWERESRPKPWEERVAVAITGGRDYTPTRADMARFWEIWDELGAEELHHGDARGVDRYVAAAVRQRRPAVRIVVHPAQWDLLGKAAGPHRNREMVAAVAAVIAFPGGRGTRSCEIAAKQAGRPVHFVVEPEAPVIIKVKAHEHDVKHWWWSSARACWTGRCAECSEMLEADRATAARLEREVASRLRGSPAPLPPAP